MQPEPGFGDFEMMESSQWGYPLNLNTYIGAEVVRIFHAGRTTGVFSAEQNLHVVAGDGMKVIVGKGVAWISPDMFGGVAYANRTDKELQFDIGEPVLNRTDRVCVRYDMIANTVLLTVKKGTPAYNPIPPPIQRDLEAWELSLSKVRINAGTTSITQAMISDERLDGSVCGLVRDGVSGIPTQQLYDQWMAAYDNSMARLQAEFSNFTEQGNTSTSQLQQMTTDLYLQFRADLVAYDGNITAIYNAWVDRMTSYQTQAQFDFDTWLEAIRGALSGDIAGSLQLQIDILKSRVPAATIGTVDTQPISASLYPQAAVMKTQWAFGLGGYGIGAFGGGMLSTIPAEFTYNAYQLSVMVPAAYQRYTERNQVSDTEFAFMADASTGDTQSLLLRIYQ